MNRWIWGSKKVIVAMSTVGSSVVAGKLIVQRFPIFLANELRFLVATIILIPLWISRISNSIPDKVIVLIQVTGALVQLDSLKYPSEKRRAIEEETYNVI